MKVYSCLLSLGYFLASQDLLQFSCGSHASQRLTDLQESSFFIQTPPRHPFLPSGSLFVIYDVSTSIPWGFINRRALTESFVPSCYSYRCQGFGDGSPDKVRRVDLFPSTWYESVSVLRQLPQSFCNRKSTKITHFANRPFQHGLKTNHVIFYAL